jgi:hypothetical protein
MEVRRRYVSLVFVLVEAKRGSRDAATLIDRLSLIKPITLLPEPSPLFLF